MTERERKIEIKSTLDDFIIPKEILEDFKGKLSKNFEEEIGQVTHVEIDDEYKEIKMEAVIYDEDVFEDLKNGFLEGFSIFDEVEGNDD